MRDDVPQPEGSQEDYKQTVEQSIPDFRYSVPYRGDGTRAMAVAQAAFAQAGFRVERMTATELRVVGPGMRGARVDPLRGATLAGVTIGGGEIRVEAALGGAVWVQRLLGLLLGGMAVLFLVGFGIAWAVLPSLRAFAWIWFFVLLPFLPWVGLGPVLALAVRRAGEGALRNLVDNMAVAAAASDPWLSESEEEEDAVVEGGEGGA